MTSGEIIEAARQQAISHYRLGERGREDVFDEVTRLASDLFDVPVSIITVLAQDEQLFRGSCGIDGDSTERGVAFCNHTVKQREVMVVEDAMLDPRFTDHPLVTGYPFIRFYAGAPILLGDGVAIGSLCLIASEPRTFSADQRRRLLLLASVVRDLMELRVGSLLALERGESLMRQTELLRATVDNIEQGIALFDRDLKLVLWNEPFRHHLGYSDNDLYEGADAASLLSIVAKRGDLGPGEPAAIVEELIRSVRSSPARRLEMRRSDGVIIDVRRATLEDGRSILAVSDVTVERQMIRMKDQFIATVSHELRTPLTSIVGAVGLLGRLGAEKLDERSRMLLGIAQQNAQRLSVLIDDILDVEKLRSGEELAFLMMRLELSDLAQQAVEQCGPYAAGLDVTLTRQPGARPLPIEGDPDRLMQALANLISNACKFSPPGEEVTVSITEHNGWARVEIADRGPGIPADFQPRLFQRFSQAGGSKQRGRSGTGLGLAITKAIVDRHDGRIDFRSAPGEGSRFWIDLPLAEEGK